MSLPPSGASHFKLQAPLSALFFQFIPYTMNFLPDPELFFTPISSFHISTRFHLNFPPSLHLFFPPDDNPHLSLILNPPPFHRSWSVQPIFFSRIWLSIAFPPLFYATTSPVSHNPPWVELVPRSRSFKSTLKNPQSKFQKISIPIFALFLHLPPYTHFLLTFVDLHSQNSVLESLLYACLWLTFLFTYPPLAWTMI